MLDEALDLGGRVSSGEAAATEYRPRRALIEVADPIDDAGTDQVEVPAFEPGGSAVPVPRTQWIAPVGAPVAEDLASSPRQAGAINGAVVARELDRLKTTDSRWVCLNSIPGGRKGTAIDHLVIGPGGVFTINAGRHPGGRAWTGGDIRAGRYQTQRVAELLTAATRICVRVQCLIVPVGAKKDVVKQPSNIVHIVNHSALVDYLRSQPPYLDGATLTRITGYARLSSTWSS